MAFGEELEQEMARIVDSYQCEWQTTLNDPQRLALFRSLVNSDQPDEAVQRPRSARSAAAAAD
ncbi:putative nitrite reductase [Klebsiella pneumoniae]|uniref:Putative nitrite reductase n=1 Tax=Klebsiella pneumoniae TaxID=573 RepID=A0A377WMG6_KLEPN|nr:putative nitrite reductase [Klebsiella pneumoniae]